MPIEIQEFEKLRRQTISGFICICGSKVIIGLAQVVRCWKCKKRWLIRRAEKVVMLIGLVRQKKCKQLPNWMTNKYGQCKRKAQCEASGRKCSASDEVYIPIEVLG